MSQRKHIPWKTKCAAALLHLVREFAYDDAKQMTEDQFLSLFHFDHNILHSSEHEDRDRFWNLTPMFIAAHREKTKQDAKVVAKSKRIRKRQSLVAIGNMLATAVEDHRASPSEAVAEALTEGFLRGVQKRKLQSRGFDKTRRKKMDGTVVKR